MTESATSTTSDHDHDHQHAHEDEHEQHGHDHGGHDDGGHDHGGHQDHHDHGRPDQGAHDAGDAAEAGESAGADVPREPTGAPAALDDLDDLDDIGGLGDGGVVDSGAAGESVLPDAAGRSDETDETDETDEPDRTDGADGVTGGSEGAGTDGADGNGTPRRGNRVRLLEKEGEVAADFLERLLDIADLDGDIEVDIDGDRAAVAIVDSEDGRVPRRLVGSDGKVLEALQELTRLAVQAETGERSRLMLDVAGHRAQRRVTLVELAHTAIAEVKTTGAKKALDDMSAFERKIVHDEVAAAGLESESEGVEPHRHIVVFPA